MGSPQDSEDFKLLVDSILDGTAPFPHTPETVSQLVQGLKTSDPVLRLKIAHVFRQGGTSALPPLAEALQSDDLEVRRAVATTLGTIGPGAEAAIPALRKALEDETIAPEAAEALNKILPPTSWVSQLDQFLGQIMPIVSVFAIVLFLVGLIYYVFREAGQTVIDMSVGFCLIGGGLGGILGGSRWGRKGAVLSAFLFAFAAALVGAAIGYVAGSIFGPVIQSLQLKKNN
jgi:hypothetical protein